MYVGDSESGQSILVPFRLLYFWEVSFHLQEICSSLNQVNSELIIDHNIETASQQHCCGLADI